MAIERIDRKEYPSFDVCIYCGASGDDVELTDEHIVPFSLGGNAVNRPIRKWAIGVPIHGW
ncbi:MAG: HNH endonuclease [Xanthobacteraceae bacterium]|jgi:hypothetical protein